MRIETPVLAADVLIELPDRRIVLIRRRNEPPGWAIPGGLVEIGETVEEAAVREAAEETGLAVELDLLFNVYSDPGRDPRHHTATVVYLGKSGGEPSGGDDAAEACAFPLDLVPGNLAFDHHQILIDYIAYRRRGTLPSPSQRSPSRLGLVERRTLLDIAREAIRSRLSPPREPASWPSNRGVLVEPGAVFVTLHRDRTLRGCIGTLAFERPLVEVVREMAIAAGFDDARFPPLSADELENLEIEISVLGPPVETDPEDIVAGWHGVSIARGRERAVFLPQVAREEGWSRRVLLEQTCMKAGLDPNDWRDPRTTIATFTAELVRA